MSDNLDLSASITTEEPEIAANLAELRYLVFQGETGNSAYEEAVAHGFVGTEEEWLASLKGEPGANGRDGQDGAPGAPGTPGRDGVSPTVQTESITGGHRVTITDAAHPQGQTFDVMDGEDGDDYVLTPQDKQEIAGMVPVPTVPTDDISANTAARHTHENKAVLDGITEAKVQSWDGKGTYSKPSGGIPASDLASGVIPSVPQMATAADMSDWTSGKTVDAALLKTDFTDAARQLLGLHDSVQLLELGKADKSEIPTKTSDLTNDSGFITASQVPSVTVDSALSTTSTNPIQNKVVKAALDSKQDKLTAGQNVTISGNTISADVDSAEIAANVTDWLDDNVTPVGSAVVVDSSLTVSGAAADAKVTGDEIGAVKSALDEAIENFAVPTQEAVDNWLTAHPEATTTVLDGSLTEAKFADSLKLKTIKDYVTPEMFGAKGDGIADDSNAIQSAINYVANENKAKCLFAYGSYKINQQIHLFGNNKTFCFYGSILHRGSEDYAILCNGLTNCNLLFNYVDSYEGGCLDFTSNESATAIMYCDVWFKYMAAETNCIRLEVTGSGYANSINFYSGRFGSGNNGIYADAHNTNEINNIKCYSLGIEGVTNGFMLKNGCNAWAILYPRASESYTTLITTVGTVSPITIELSDYVTNTNKFSLSNQTYGILRASIMGNHPWTSHTEADIVSGSFHPRPLNDFLELTNDLDLTNSTYVNTMYCPTIFRVLSGCTHIKLNEFYGYGHNINQFFLSFQKDAGSQFVLEDTNGTVIINNTTNIGWAHLRIIRLGELGWRVEKIPIVSVLNS